MDKDQLIFDVLDVDKRLSSRGLFSYVSGVFALLVGNNSDGSSLSSLVLAICASKITFIKFLRDNYTKQLLDEVEHDIMNYQNRGLCYLPKPLASADNTDSLLSLSIHRRFWPHIELLCHLL